MHQHEMQTNEQERAIQEVFRALADPTRRDILTRLSHNDLTIAEVAEHYDITRGAVKKHLAILEEGQLISVHKRGREKVNQLQAKNFQYAANWMDYFRQFWDTKLSALQDAVERHE